MPENSERVCFTLGQEIGQVDAGGAPEEVQILPFGEVRPKGKTPFTVDEVSIGLILAAFEGGKTDLVVDYEHQSLSGSEAPAAGWIKALEDRGPDGLWGAVQWTDRAKEYLKNREYRYLSPVVLIRKKDGRAVELLGAALTNLPAIDGMMPVVNTSRPGPADVHGEKYARVMGLLGLPEDAGLDEAYESVLALTKPKGFVPSSEYEALKATLSARDADDMVKEALASGRITHALLPWARSYAAGDPEGFREFVGRACPVVPLGGKADLKPRPSVDTVQGEVNAMLGLSDEAFIRYGRAVS